MTFAFDWPSGLHLISPVVSEKLFENVDKDKI